MKTILKSVVIGSTLAVILFGAIETQAPLGIRLVPDAHAIIGLPFTPLSFAGVARRTAFRTMMWSGAAASASSAAAAQHQAAAAQQQAAAANNKRRPHNSKPPRHSTRPRPPRHHHPPQRDISCRSVPW